MNTYLRIIHILSNKFRIYAQEKKNCQLNKQLGLGNKHWLNGNHAFLDCLWQGNLEVNSIEQTDCHDIWKFIHILALKVVRPFKLITPKHYFRHVSPFSCFLAKSELQNVWDWSVSSVPTAWCYNLGFPKCLSQWPWALWISKKWL